MHLTRLRAILEEFDRCRVLVAGDFFLDQYWSFDPALQETSVETGKIAHQIVEVRTSPGAAGTVAKNLAALQVGRVSALGAVGEDGNGQELIWGLKRRGVETEGLVVSPRIRTPTYTKPMRREDQSEEEQERFDIKNRTSIPVEIEEIVLERLESMVPEFDAVIILDQVSEQNCGVVTERFRGVLARLAEKQAGSFFLADSRSRIHSFRHVSIKPNQEEASRALADRPLQTETQEEMTRALLRETRAPQVFLTQGAKGLCVCDRVKFRSFPAAPVEGPIDPVGAGDSVSAAIAASMAAGADAFEAARIGLLAGGVTVLQVGTTGVATRQAIVSLAAQAAEEGLGDSEG